MAEEVCWWKQKLKRDFYLRAQMKFFVKSFFPKEFVLASGWWPLQQMKISNLRKEISKNSNYFDNTIWQFTNLFNMRPRRRARETFRSNFFYFKINHHIFCIVWVCVKILTSNSRKETYFVETSFFSCPVFLQPSFFLGFERRLPYCGEKNFNFVGKKPTAASTIIVVVNQCLHEKFSQQ